MSSVPHYQGSIYMNKLPNSIIIGGKSDGERVYADAKAHQVVHRGERYLRVPGWLVGNQDIFVPATVSYEQLMQMLVETYERSKQQ
jgi:hypothetical protein